MEKRTYTISNVLGKMDTPSLRITGKWLSEKGFNIGDKLEVIESKNMIILTKVPKRKVLFQEALKEYKVVEKQLNNLAMKVKQLTLF